MSAGHQPMLVKAQTPHVSGKPLDTMAHSGFSQSKRFQELPGPKDCLPKEEMKVGNGHSVALGDSESRGGKSGCRGLRPCQLPSSPAAPCCAQLGLHLTPTPSPETGLLPPSQPQWEVAGSFFMACREVGRETHPPSWG